MGVWDGGVEGIECIHLLVHDAVSSSSNPETSVHQ
jgi:hypothetical protein